METLTPAQAAKVLGKSRSFITAIIAAGELLAWDERSPGSSRPRYRTTRDALEAWRESRRVRPPASELDRRMATMPSLEGVLAASRARRLARAASAAASSASRALGILVVAFSFGLGGAELLGVDLDRIALPTGLVLFATVISVRVWARSDRLKPSPAVPAVA